MSDPTFEALENIPGHISSFSASAQDGALLQSSTEGLKDTSKIAYAAYQLLTDATLLRNSIPDMQQDKIKRITVTYPMQYHAFTVSNDIIYGIERANISSSQ